MARLFKNFTRHGVEKRRMERQKSISMTDSLARFSATDASEASDSECNFKLKSSLENTGNTHLESM